MDTLNSNRLLRLREVSDLTSLGKSTINLWVVQERFPRPIALSKTIKVWRQSDIEQWIGQVCAIPEEQDAPGMQSEQKVQVLYR
jgi:prophage regulatory protein